MSIRTVLVSGAVALAAFATPVTAQVPGNALKDMLGNASDAPSTSCRNPARSPPTARSASRCRGRRDKLSGLMKLTDQAGLTNDISGNLNHAAEEAASEAKPIFRSAIDKASMNDAVGIAKGGDTGATEYLRKSSGSEIAAKLRPLVKAALDRSGLLKGNSTLSSIGMSPEKLTEYVTGKTSDGIFTYVGREEKRLRADPLGSGKELLKGLKF